MRDLCVFCPPRTCYTQVVREAFRKTFSRMDTYYRTRLDEKIDRCGSRISGRHEP